MSEQTITIEPTVPALTKAGLDWALGNVSTSIVARVAIAPSWDTDWPTAHRRIAVIQANTEGMRQE